MKLCALYGVPDGKREKFEKFNASQTRQISFSYCRVSFYFYSANVD